MNAYDDETLTTELAAGLAGLATDPPRGVLDRVVARWVRVPGPEGGLHVAYTDAGVSFVRTVAAIGPDDDAFRAVFGERYERPLRRVKDAPGDLVAAVRSHDARALTFDLRGVPAFAQQVLRTALTIPPGEVRPYGWVAARAGKPAAVRAAASSLARNPVPVLVPCHRVVQADGRLGRYLFGPEVKAGLLAGEGLDLTRLGTLAGEHVRYLADERTGVVCLPTCAVARAVPPARAVTYRTLAAATTAGRRPCEVCHPEAGERPER